MRRVSSSSPSIQAVRYKNPREPDLPVEVVSLAELRIRAPPGFLASPRRPKFHQVHVVTDGHLELELDFERVSLDHSAVAWVRPGQVLRFDLHAGVGGWLLMFTPEFLDAGVADEPVGSRVELGSAVEDVTWLLERLRRVSEEEAHEERHALLRHLLHAFLLILRRRARSSTRPCPSSTRAVFTLFRNEVEQRFATTRRVEDYERIIGYSSKTLSRAARAATGLNAKEYIDQRVLLEGRRLLVHTRLSAGEVAQRLGFSELTNFIKFFRRNGGESPSEFRRRGSFVEADRTSAEAGQGKARGRVSRGGRRG
jgi:AraC-like DNA-binding protein